jgi:pantetheine-phosphate adenylyltransferase
MRTCIFPGSFDPPTIGHLDIIKRAAALFDRVCVAVMDNGQKRAAFLPEERVEMLKKCTDGMSGVNIMADGGLLADLARRMNADAIIRGLRGEQDMFAEGQMAAVNHRLCGVETVFLFTMPEHSHIGSAIVREVARHGGDVSGMVPDAIRDMISIRFN